MIKQTIKQKKQNLEVNENKIKINNINSSSEKKIFKIFLHFQEMTLFNKRLKFTLKFFENDMKETVSFLIIVNTDCQHKKFENNLNQMKQMKQRMKQQMNNKMNEILNVLKRMKEKRK